MSVDAKALAADLAVVRAQRDSLISALEKVLKTADAEAKASASMTVAVENFSDGGALEQYRYLWAQQAASEASAEARTLLATLKRSA